MSDEDIRWLKYFYREADFGPAHTDVVHCIMQSYEREGHKVPANYRDGYEEMGYFEEVE